MGLIIYRPERPLNMGVAVQQCGRNPLFVVMRGEAQDVGLKYQTEASPSSPLVAGVKPGSHFECQTFRQSVNKGPILNRPPLFSSHCFLTLDR